MQSYPTAKWTCRKEKQVYWRGISCHAQRKNLPDFYWAEAVATAVYIMNRTPTAAIHGMTPEERYTGRKPDISHLKIFGCIAYVHVPDELRSKLDPKAEKCIFIGYSLQ